MWLSALAFLATLAFTLAATALAAYGAIRHRPRRALWTGIAAAAGVALYAAALVGAGMLSHARELSAGEEKHICEIDCHLAYAVVRTARAQPTHFDVTMRVRFDPETTSSQRGDAPMYPGPRRIILFDAEGAEYQPTETTGLDRALRPGESTEAHIVFEVPASAKPVRLRFEDADPTKWLLIGSETAPLHKRTVFNLS